MCFQRDLGPVAISQIDSGPLACGHHLQIFKATPVLDDLIESRLAMAFVAKFCESPLPGLGRLHILASILVCLSHHVARGLGERVIAALENLLENLDRVEFVRQLQATNTCGQLGNCFVIPQRMDCVRPAVVLVILATAASPQPGHGLHPKLVMQELGPGIVGFVAQAIVELDGLQQHPAPAFAI